LASRGCPVDNIRLGEVVLGVVYLEKELDLTIAMEKRYKREYREQTAS